jgi:hypothetical protein
VQIFKDVIYFTNRTRFCYTVGGKSFARCRRKICFSNLNISGTRQDIANLFSVLESPCSLASSAGSVSKSRRAKLYPPTVASDIRHMCFAYLNSSRGFLYYKKIQIDKVDNIFKAWCVILKWLLYILFAMLLCVQGVIQINPECVYSSAAEALTRNHLKTRKDYRPILYHFYLYRFCHRLIVCCPQRLKDQLSSPLQPKPQKGGCKNFCFRPSKNKTNG